MNANDVEGGFKKATGKAQALSGEVLNDPYMELDGDLRRAEGSVQEMIGQVQDAIADAADTLSATAVKVGDRARETYANVTVQVQRAADQVDPFVKQKPYAALGLAALGGVLFGLLFAGRGPKIIYVRPRH